MAGKTNTSPSEIDKTSFAWVAGCGACHPGGGPGEFDRDGVRYFDVVTGRFGYETLGKTPAQVELDGDYAFVNPGDGSLMPAPWHKTGVSEPDCLSCHRSERSVDSGKDMNWVWRTATLRGAANLVDANGRPVMSFSAAPTAGQGWFSQFAAQATPGTPPTATLLQIDYDKGVDQGALYRGPQGMTLAGSSIVDAPRDQACWGCHVTPDLKKRARVWFDPDRDVHYRFFNNLADGDPGNDIGPLDSQVCSRCHDAGMDHEIGKGNAFAGSVRNHGDWENLQTCRDCHLGPNAMAPLEQGGLHLRAHLDRMACQLCHIPYRASSADLVVDNAVTGKTVGYRTDEFLSAAPLVPSAGDKSRWWPAILEKEDEDGRMRLFPNKLLLTIWWGDWNRNATPNNLSDDVIEPLILWRIRQITGAQPLPGVVDDNQDGKPELNTPAEIALYMDALRQQDIYGNRVAENPVLVKGGKVFYMDRSVAPPVVRHFEYHGTGIKVESSVPFSIDHNVLNVEQALGAGGDCAVCHAGSSTVFDRKVLIDPFDENGEPVYVTPRDMVRVFR